MTFRCGGILRSMSDDERRRQMDRVRDAIQITERQATPEELTEAAAPLATEPSARQPELDLKAK
jgi:hypothetical protein